MVNPFKRRPGNGPRKQGFGDELRQNHYYFAQWPGAESEICASNEGELRWCDLSEALTLPMPVSAGYALRDYAALLADQGREDESARALEGALGVYRLAKDDPRAVAGAIATLDMQAVAHVKAGRREQAAVKLREFLAEVAVLPADQAARWLERAREAERVLAQLES